MIRKLTTSDHEAFRAIRLLGLELEPVAFATMASAWRAASRERTLAPLEVSESDAPSLVLGSFEGDELVGMVGFRREARTSLDHKGSVWGLFVVPDHRRRGIAQSLLDEVIAEATRLGLRYLRLVTATSSVAAVKLFESVGFEPYGLESGSIKDGDRYFDHVFMMRALT